MGDAKNACQEFLDTEQTYIENLTAMVNVCKAAVALKLIDERTASVIFLNIDELLGCSQELLRLVTVHGTTLRQIAYAFTACSEPMIHAYRPYLREYLGAQRILEQYMTQQRFREVVEPFMVTLDETRSIPLIEGNKTYLTSLIVTPIQRICKYQLLFKAMLKLTELDLELGTQVQAAATAADNLCNLINEGVKETAVSSDAALTSSTRKLLRELKRTNSQRGSLMAVDGTLLSPK
jgi:hypothetical protein